MSQVYSLNQNKIVSFQDFKQEVEKSTEKFLEAYPKMKDSGIVRQEQMILQQMEQESARSRKGKVKTLLLTEKDTKKLGDKMRKTHRGIPIKNMERVLSTLVRQGLKPLPVSENWLGEGFVGLGDFGTSQCATMDKDGNITTFFPLRGLTSRLKTFHWTQGHSFMGEEVLVPSIVVVDENHDYVTPAGEILTNPSINDQKLNLMVRPAEGVEAMEITRKFKSGRVVDSTGLKGVTIPCEDLGTISYEGHVLDVNLIAGPNSLKGGLTQMRILGNQFRSMSEAKITDQLGEILTGIWKLPNGRKIEVKFGLSFVRLTELSDMFDSFGTHRMGTEVVRSLQLQGNEEAVDWLLRQTEYGTDLVFRQMRGEIKPVLPSVKLPDYVKGKKWSIDSLVTNWDLVPFPEHAGEWNGRLVPSKQMVMNASTLLTGGTEWIMPAWATAWASVILSKMSKNYPNWERLNAALEAAMSSKKGTTRTSIRPKVACLQGKQVAHSGMSQGDVGTTKENLVGEHVMVIRYPLLWNQVSKAQVVAAPAMIGPFQIVQRQCKGLIFRNFNDMGYEQSDADGDVSFAYKLPEQVWRSITEVCSVKAHEEYQRYIESEASAVLKDRPVVVHNYKDVLQELLLASKNKSAIGIATMDLWKIADLGYEAISNDDLIKVLDYAAFYIQDVVVKGIKHELKGGSSEYNLAAYLLTIEEISEFHDLIVQSLDENLEDTMKRMGLTYSPRKDMCNVQAANPLWYDSWISMWMRRVFAQTPEKLIFAELTEFLKGLEDAELQEELAEAM